MSSFAKPRALYVLSSDSFNKIYGVEERRDISKLVDISDVSYSPKDVSFDPSLLEDVEIIFSGWGGPILDSTFLSRAPKLKAFLYGAGATGGMIHREAWERGIRVTSAAKINGIPVAEYTLAAILFSLKHALRFMRLMHGAPFYPRKHETLPGGYGSTMALVSLGAIGKEVARRLKDFDLEVIVYDPFISDDEMRNLGVQRVSLEDAFFRSDVVSIHTPWLPETEGMITGAHISSMKPGATLINTSRGAVIIEREMIEVLSEREDLTAVLDVTYPEPPENESPLWSLPNVFLTPHIAGSVDGECRRMGAFIVEELRRYLRGEEMEGEIHPESALHTSHRTP
jgi:phosphoglycerate dehydrogenase-like enzyme